MILGLNSAMFLATTFFPLPLGRPRPRFTITGFSSNAAMLFSVAIGFKCLFVLTESVCCCGTGAGTGVGTGAGAGGLVIICG